MGKLTTKKVEEKGIRILDEYFEDCELVDTCISRNDKEPLWDGNIYLFNSSNQKAEQVYGRVPTQVKTLSKVSEKDCISYSVKKTALNSYKREGGILYFVVLHNNPENRKIYCCYLTPVLIKKYLRAPGTRDSASISLKLFPEDKQLTTEELFQFYYDCKNQTSSADKPIVELKDYFEKSGKRMFSVFAKSPGKIDDFLGHMQTRPMYLYATDDQGNITFPLGDGPVFLHTGHNLEQNVSVNGIPYFHGCTIFSEGDEQVITIGDFFTYRSGSKTQKAKLNIKLSGHSNLNKITYLSFCLALFKNKSFSVGPVEVPCDGINPPNDVVDRMKQELKILTNVRSLFSALHIDGDINIDDLNSNEISNLEAFYKGIVLKEPLTIKKGHENDVRISIGNHVLYLMFCPIGDGKYEVRDFFTNEDVCCLLTENSITTKSSRFTLLNVDQFAEASNFDYSGMISSYETFVKDDEKVAQLANLDMLRMILAFDKTSGKKSKLLEAAEVLNNWFIRTNRFQETPINEINKYQIIKRRRPLTEEEKNIIIELSESDIQEDCKTACCLLLDNQSSADYHFKKIPEENKEFFKSLPIYKFWNNNNIATTT